MIRDAFQGLSRFDQFQKSLGVAPNMLARRLKHLTEVGVLEKRQYSDRPARYEYVLTRWGRDFFPVLVTLFQWGNQQNMPHGTSMLLGAVENSSVRRPVLVDEETGEKITLENTLLLAGPAADATTLERVERVRSYRGARAQS